ncbi:Cmx/CmrA family chloramphenicol efflux MFS transporter [Glycomyces algeriensis]|uniref:Chloramphenicol resistance protein n=1 Tax=Glycomyces algeriensis TaxID=256037 RepID=A0A9W6G6D2_9ACTN|nr:Cmx/CmrA family chloramphenicol efflux MFS transporter [Glycomyces algeriensis]MDA1367195.1 MFS transporter [Glycomyces algeriensis]MDR7353421.1 DHA1 family chloramphenicol resistance protein-like MFS transporter [Glycomyces algeriensis]GLI41118.1 chloramphenicol resistance protein [Glycomyces algeriensis]
MPLPVYLLALAVFAMGTSEFMLAGLLPDLAADLGVTVATAGLLTTAFAAGMAVGAPLTAALARRRPPRATLLAFLGLFSAAHVVGAVTDQFAVLLATRVVAAFANAGFLAVALTATAALAAPDRKGRALAVLLGGITIATIAGVPGGALLGTLLGWRATFWAVAFLCLPAALGLIRGLPDTREGDGPRLRTELAALRGPRLLLVMGLGALVNAATFGAFTYIAPVVTGTAGLDALWVPVVLVLFGAGSFTGVTVAGRLSDRRPGRVIAVAGPLLLIGWCALGLLAAHPAALLLLAFTQGALAFAVGSTLIARVLHEAADAPTMAGSYATAALNVGAASGPVIAALALGAGPAGPLWAAAVLVAAALLIAVPGRRVFALR